MGILALGKARSLREPNLGCRGVLKDLGDVALCQKPCTRAVEWAGALSWWSWSARSAICECDGHTVHKLSQRRLTADWLAPRESDCSLMHGKVSSDRLPSYIKATRPVLEVLKMYGCFPDSPRTKMLHRGRAHGTELWCRWYYFSTRKSASCSVRRRSQREILWLACHVYCHDIEPRTEEWWRNWWYSACTKQHCKLLIWTWSE